MGVSFDGRVLRTYGKLPISHSLLGLNINDLISNVSKQQPPNNTKIPFIFSPSTHAVSKPVSFLHESL